MSALEVIILLASVVSLAILVAYFMQSGKDEPTEEPTTSPTYTKEELENIKLAEELYNKDLRQETPQPTVAVKVEDIAVTEPELVAKVVETAKVLPPEGVITLEAIVEKPKSEFPIDKPKKKRKPRPKTKK